MFCLYIKLSDTYWYIPDTLNVFQKTKDDAYKKRKRYAPACDFKRETYTQSFLQPVVKARRWRWNDVVERTSSKSPSFNQ